MRIQNNIPLWAIRQRGIVISIFSLVVAYGIYQFFVMDRQADPNIRVLQGSIVTTYPPGTEQEVEKEVTNRIEDYLFTFKQINREKTQSVSAPGVSYIKAELTADVDNPTEFWSKLQHGLNQLPVSGATIQTDWAEITQIILVVSSPTRSPREIKMFTDSVRHLLLEQDGVAGVRQMGEQPEEIGITVNPQQLKMYQLDIETVIQGITSNHQALAGGTLTQQAYSLPFSVTGRLHTIESIKNISIPISQGKNIPLSAVASVSKGYGKQKMAIGTQGNAIMLGVTLKSHINEVAVGKQLTRQLDALRNDLPNDIIIKTVVSEPAYVDYTIRQFNGEFFVVLLVVTFVLIVSLPFRTAIVASIAAPISVFIAIAIISMIGLPLQQVVIAGLILSLGLVVDDAIVVADNFLDLRARGYGISAAAWKSAYLLLRPLTLATVCIMVIFFPLAMFTVGLAKEFMVTLPITVAIAVGASFFVAVFITPILCWYMGKWELYRRKPLAPEKKKNRWSVYLQQRYDKLIDWSFANKKKVVFTSFGITLVGIVLLAIAPQVFFPNADINKFNVLVNLPVNASLAQTRAVAQQLEDRIRQDEGVRDVTAFLGVSAFRFHVTYAPHYASENFAQLFITTDDVASTRRLARLYVDSLEGSIPGVDIQVRTLNFNQTEAPIEIHIAGSNLQELKHIGAEICDRIKNINGINYVRTSFGRDYTGLDVVAKNSVTSDYQAPKAAIGRIVQAAGDGINVGTFYENDEKINLVVHLEKAGGFLDGIGMVPVRSINGGMTTLSEVVDCQLKNHTAAITHRNGERVLTVLAEAQKGVPASKVFKEVDKRIRDMALPAGYSLQYGGEIATVLENLPGLVTAILAGLFIIYLLSLLVYKNFSMAALVILTFVLSVPGAALGLYVTGYPLGFTAAVGLLALTAVVQRNAITKLEYAILYMAEGHSVEESAKEAAKRRMRPVVLTSVVASMGLITMIAGGSSMWGPLATVIAFGVLFSVFQTLLVIPVLFAMWVKLPSIRFSRPRWYPAVATALFILLAVVPSKAQELNLEGCKEKALQNNIGIKATREQMKYKTEAVTVSRLSAAPKISGNVYGFATGAPLKDLLAPYGGVASIGVEQLIYGGGYTHIKRRGAVLGKEIAEVDLEAKINKVLFATEKLYWEYQTASASEAVVSQHARAIERSLFETKEAIRAGSQEREDSLLLAVAFMENAVHQKQIATQLRLLKARICLLIGTDTATVVISRNEKPVMSNELFSKQEDTTSLHPLVRQAGLRSQELQVEIDLLKAAGRPKVALTGGPYYWLGPAGSGGMLPKSSFVSGYGAVGLSIPIFDGGSRRAQVTALNYQLSATRYQEQLTKAALDLSRQEVSAKIQIAEETLQIAVEKGKAMEALLRLRQAQFRAGRVSRKMLLEAETDNQQYCLEILKAGCALRIEKARQFYRQELPE